ncbi:calcium-dependent protein kinase [Musa troglodytarum]|uniref:non-specific serine/threonine protein kinase n=1 Tax=Musa troglodytarum TaxID=320322 RepID=A0A9E7G2B3_9LILI|nr:calcium-dependent protein kinase [Musa troglodytarum]
MADGLRLRLRLRLRLLHEYRKKVMGALASDSSWHYIEHLREELMRLKWMVAFRLMESFSLSKVRDVGDDFTNSKRCSNYVPSRPPSRTRHIHGYEIFGRSKRQRRRRRRRRRWAPASRAPPKLAAGIRPRLSQPPPPPPPTRGNMAGAKNEQKKQKPRARNGGKLKAVSRLSCGRRTNFGYDREFERRYSIGKLLGHGQFGYTFVATDKANGDRVAVKRIDKNKMTLPIAVEDVKREVKILKALKGHENVVDFYNAFEDDSYVYIVMELCEGGELLDRILAKYLIPHNNPACKREPLYRERCCSGSRQMLKVAAECHLHGLVHRDMKPENFLFKSTEEDCPLKATDFGLSDFIRPGKKFHDIVGSAYYVAPEVLKRRSGPESDAWSIGVITYILLCGRRPFWDKTEDGIYKEVLRTEPDFRRMPWSNISECAKDFVKKLLVKDPRARLTAAQALSHPWAREGGDALEIPLDISVLSNMRQFVKYSRFKQFALRALASTLNEEELADLKDQFHTIDVDKSGAISVEEMRHALGKDLPWKLKEPRVLEIVQAMDSNTDGFIDFEEFVAATLHVHQLVEHDNGKWRSLSKAAFDKFDVDKNGYITPDELRMGSLPARFSRERALEDILEFCPAPVTIGKRKTEDLTPKNSFLVPFLSSKRQRESYTEKDAAVVVRQMLKVAAECHLHGLVHRDMKPEIFFLLIITELPFKSTEEDCPLKATDFGLSDFIRPGKKFHDIVGSAYYVAPEVLRTEPDFRRKPWPNISECAKDFVKKLLVKDPRARLTAAQALSHPWAREGDALEIPLDISVLSNMRQFVKYSRFKQFALRALASTLNEEELADLKDQFHTIDVDKSGAISVEEMRHALGKDLPWKLKEPRVLEIVQAMDSNTDGFIDFEEFVAATLHVHQLVEHDNGKWRSLSKAAFDKFDVDKNGYITPDELRMHTGLKGSIDPLLEEVDIDKDGKISLDEFRRLLKTASMKPAACLVNLLLMIKESRYTEKDAAVVVRQMLKVAAECHLHGLVHRDMKPEIFLLIITELPFKSTEEDCPLKATDFGLSDFIRPGKKFHDIVGSAYYVAPAHPWAREGDALEIPLDISVLSNMRQFVKYSRFKQFALRALASTLNEEELADLKDQFHTIDVDKSGAISVEEMRHALGKDLPWKLKEPRVLEIVQAHTGLKGSIDPLLEEVDIDKDGKISLDEFRRLLKTASMKPRSVPRQSTAHDRRKLCS